MGAQGAALATSMSYGVNLVIKFVIYYYLVKIAFWRLLLPGRHSLIIIKEVLQKKNRNE